MIISTSRIEMKLARIIEGFEWWKGLIEALSRIYVVSVFWNSCGKSPIILVRKHHFFPFFSPMFLMSVGQWVSFLTNHILWFICVSCWPAFFLVLFNYIPIGLIPLEKMFIFTFICSGFVCRELWNSTFSRLSHLIALKLTSFPHY